MTSECYPLYQPLLHTVWSLLTTGFQDQGLILGGVTYHWNQELAFWVT